MIRNTNLVSFGIQGKEQHKAGALHDHGPATEHQTVERGSEIAEMLCEERGRRLQLTRMWTCPRLVTFEAGEYIASTYI